MVSKLAWGIGWNFIKHSKIWKLVLWWALFIQRVMFQLDNFGGIICHENERWKLKTGSWLQKWQRIWLMFMRVVESLEIWTWWVPFVESISSFRWEAQKGYLWWHWRMIQSFKKNLLLVKKWHDESGKF